MTLNFFACIALSPNASHAMHDAVLAARESIIVQRISQPWRTVTRAVKLKTVRVIAYLGGAQERIVDHVVVEHGTRPTDELYFELKPLSTNSGVADLQALVEGLVQAQVHNTQGKFRLFRVGDAVSSRDVHAALYDSLRLCMCL